MSLTVEAGQRLFVEKVGFGVFLVAPVLRSFFIVEVAQRFFGAAFFHQAKAGFFFELIQVLEAGAGFGAGLLGGLAEQVGLAQAARVYTARRAHLAQRFEPLLGLGDVGLLFALLPQDVRQVLARRMRLVLAQPQNTIE